MNENVKQSGPTRSVALERAEGPASNQSSNSTLGDIIARRYSRRDIIRGALAATAITATVSPLALLAADKARAQGTTKFDFSEIVAGVDDKHHVAEGYDADILIRWGDPIFPDSPEFDPMNHTASAQARQFGYNNDFLGLIPVPGAESDANRMLLVVNHEYTTEELMFPGLGRQDAKDVGFKGMTADLVAIEMMAHGGSVVEIARGDNGKWAVVRDSGFNRRVTADTEMELTGPAAGNEQLKTSADPTGTKVLGMLNNCAGGVTPWGTWLSGEENIHGYFIGEEAGEEARGEEDDPGALAYTRYGIPGGSYAWGRFHDRFNVTKEPNEPNRFGWVVEIDPHDASSTPKKRTALGRAKHEGAAGVINKDGRYVVYTGDDERFEYVYKFVTAGTVNQNDRAANMNLLDEGTLYVARFSEDGTLTWLPLVHGEGALTAENGFRDQADVLILARRAADFLEATKMDRPEDIEANPATGKVYVMLTNNVRRKPEEVDAANPRPESAFGHIIEMTAPDMDHAATEFTWDILVRCGDPKIAEVGATFNPATSENGWFGMPDNCVVDSDGRLWISTDGNSGKSTGRSDGLWSLETEGEERATSKHFFRCPAGGEMCGPIFTPDVTALFVAVQHPGEDGEDWPEFGRASTYDDPSTRWPDFQDGIPPRPAVVAITRQGGGKIAG